jgi:hypothetical protein
MSELWTQICAEFDRLGLQLADSPYQAFAASAEGGERFLASLRRLPSGATWRDVFPDMPAHWVLGRPETWTVPYRPLGDFDYRELPAGPAVHIHWPERPAESPLEEFVEQAIAAGWPIYGAGHIEQVKSWGQFDAHVVLQRGTDEDTFDEFLVWIDQQPGVETAVITRPVGDCSHTD